LKAASITEESKLTALVQAVEQVRATTTAEQVWSQAAAYLGQELQTHLASEGRTGAVWVWLASYDAARNTLVGKDGVVPNPKEEGTLLRQRFGVTAGDVWQRALQSQTPLDIPDWSKEPKLGEWANKMKRLHPVGVTLCPLPEGTGVAWLGIPDWGSALRPDGKLRVRLFLAEMGQQLRRLEQRQQHQQTRQAGEFLTQVMLKCRPQSSYEERLALMAEQVHQAVRADQTLVYAYDERANHFILKTSAPRLRREEVVPLAMIQGLYQNLMLGELVAIADARATTGAVTVRSTRPPKDTTCAPCFCNQAISAGLHPPSGPISTANAAGSGRSTVKRCGLSGDGSHTNLGMAPTCVTAVTNDSAGNTAGIHCRQDCSAASVAIRRQRSIRPGPGCTCVRSVSKGQICRTPSSVACRTT